VHPGVIRRKSAENPSNAVPPKIRRKKIRLVENPPKNEVSRPQLSKKFGWEVYPGTRKHQFENNNK
jgi:hypothetical protein